MHILAALLVVSAISPPNRAPGDRTLPLRERSHPLERGVERVDAPPRLPAAVTTHAVHDTQVPIIIDEQTLARIARIIIPLTHNEVSESYIDHFLTVGKGTLRIWLKRAGRYLRLFERELARFDLPRELVWLASMESGFRPDVTSWAGARGLWQFMPKTGARYALRQTAWVDERRDPAKATRAAARHLRDLYNEFKDWHLVLAAYNTGAGYVNAGIRKHKTRDFFELRRRRHWARETGNYVPKYIALTRLATSRESYSAFRGLVVPEEDRSSTIALSRATDLRRLGKIAGTPYATLRELNPELNTWCTPPEHAYGLRVPNAHRAAILRAALRIERESPERFVMHNVKRGERLAKIAARYNVTAKAIASHNGLSPGSRLRPNARLIIAVPARPVKVASANRTDAADGPFSRQRNLGD